MEVFAHTSVVGINLLSPLNLLNLVSVDLAGIMFTPEMSRKLIAREL